MNMSMDKNKNSAVKDISEKVKNVKNGKI